MTSRKKQFSSRDSYRLKLYKDFLEDGSKKLLKKINLEKCTQIIDAGCGDGDMTIWLSEQVKADGKVIALDKSSDALKKLEKKCKALNVNNVEFHEIDISISAQKNFSADLVYGRCLLMHVPNSRVAISNLLKFINPEGMIILEEPVISAFKNSATKNLWGYPVSLYKKYCLLTGTNPDFGKQLPAELLEYNLSIEHFGFYAEEIDVNLAKKYIKYSLGSAIDLYENKGIADLSSMKSFLEDLECKNIDASTPITFHTMAQIIAKKTTE